MNSTQTSNGEALVRAFDLAQQVHERMNANEGVWMDHDMIFLTLEATGTFPADARWAATFDSRAPLGGRDGSEEPFYERPQEFRWTATANTPEEAVEKAARAALEFMDEVESR